MDRNLSFFISINDRLGPDAEIINAKDKTAFASATKARSAVPRTSGKSGAGQYDADTGYYKDDLLLDDPYQKAKTPAVLLKSNFNKGIFINYRGNNHKSNNLIISSGPEMQDISLSSIIKWSSDKESVKLRAMDFAYLKNFHLPANRMMVLRRYPDGAPASHDPFNMKVAPYSTLVGYIDPTEDTSFTISFNEKWEPSVKTGFIDVINSIISMKESFTKFPTFNAHSNLEQAIGMRVAKAFGITNSADNPLGDPNVIHEAAIRTTGAMEDGDGYNGLESKFDIKFQTEYVQQYIDGVDPGVAWLDIIANAIRMGTSNSKFIITGGVSSELEKMIKMMESGRTDEVVMMIIGVIQDALSDLTGLVSEVLKDLADGVKEVGNSLMNGDGEGALDSAKESAQKAFEDGKDLLNKVLDEMNKLVATTVKKYKWPLRGALASMSGAHSAPWHVAMGNPKAPWFCSGNLICQKLELTFGNELGFNDMPTTMKVTADLIPGRNLGGQELEKLFNTGGGRIYVS
jgi:hypothetical protein